MKDKSRSSCNLLDNKSFTQREYMYHMQSFLHAQCHLSIMLDSLCFDLFVYTPLHSSLYTHICIIKLYLT